MQCRFYEAGSSEMFGQVARDAADERRRRSIRAARTASRKVFGYWITRNYREAYGMYAVNGILFNHESPRRGPTFVTRKITRAIGAILRGEQNELRLGNLDAKRDWGYARDYMEGAWRMLQADEPDDYVLATGETHSVREFLDEAFGYAGLDWNEYVKIDERYFRPAEVDVLLGDASKAKEKLGWEPNGPFPGARPDDGRPRPRTPTNRRALRVIARLAASRSTSRSTSSRRRAAPRFRRIALGQLVAEARDSPKAGEGPLP